MDTAPPNDFAAFRELLANRQISQLALEFQLLPGRYLHPSWLHGHACQAWLQPLCARLSPAALPPAAEIRLTAYLVKAFALEDDNSPPWFSHFTCRTARIALCDSAVLEHLVMRLGLAVYSDSLKRCVSRAEVQALRDGVGIDGHIFAIKRAPFFGLRVAPPPLQFELPLVPQLAHAGMRCIATALDTLSPALSRRLLLKLPKDWAASFALDPAYDQTAVRALPVKLVKELLPKWAYLVA